MCLIHLRPANARTPSPDQFVPSRPITRGNTLPPLSPHSYPNNSSSNHHPRSNRNSKQATIHTQSTPRVSRTSDLRRLSIQSQEQWDATRRKELEAARETERKAWEMQQMPHPPPPHQQQQPPQAPDPPLLPLPLTHTHPTSSTPQHQPQRRISFQAAPRPPPPPEEKIVVFKDPAPIPTLRHGSDYSYGEGPVFTSASSLTTPSYPTTTTTNKNNNAATESGAGDQQPGKQKPPPHRRRESSVSVVNGRDGSVLERSVSGQLYVLGGGGGADMKRRPGAGAPRRSTGSVRGSVNGSVEGSSWGKDPRASTGGRSVRERIVVVDEVRGTRRREYVRERVGG